MRLPLLITVAATAIAAPLAAQPLAEPAGVTSVVFRDAPRAGLDLRHSAPRFDLAAAYVSRGPVSDTARRRPPAVEHSDFYYKRLAVHRWASYATLPVFAAQYYLGEKIIDDRNGTGDDDSDAKGLHGAAAGAIAGLFAINTVTGAWNWWDDRHEPAGRTKRTVHAIAMLIADAGFVATGVTANSIEDDDEGEGGGGASTHRDIAIASMGLATASTLVMWFWKD